MRYRDRLRLLLGALSAQSPAFRGKTRLARRLDRLLGAGPLPEVERGGVRWQLDTSELIQFGIFYHGGYGAAVAESLARLGRERGPGPLVLWDIGANIGSVSLPLLARLPNLQVEAFEPSPRVLERLRQQVGLNPALAARLRIHPLALSDGESEMAFYESASATNQGIGSLMPMHNTKTTGASVEGASGDALIARGVVLRPDLIKLDVEGWELNVLRGLAATLSAHHPPVVMEYEAYRHAAAGRSLRDFEAFFRACGYGRFAAVAADGGFEPLGERASVDVVVRR
jgi:FkbM family methyltransferase